ncbi:MAG: hypothetical protein LBK13_13420 [Spirochaetales bacterium]|jgi:hypothetical protein|nr:hypothetical protein [Spirochaetales bacterium]
MKKRRIFLIAAVLCAGFPVFSLFAQNEKENDAFFSFDLHLGLGVLPFANAEYIPGGSEPKSILYQTARLSPGFRLGKFGMDFDFDLNFRFDGGDNGERPDYRKEDWEYDGAWEFFNLYVPKIRSVRYGGEGDPFILRLGSIQGITLGNGFIVSSYTNEMFAPENRVLGGTVNIFGDLVDIPYFGIDIFTSNVTRFDVTGGRFYVQPLKAFSTSIIKDLEAGVSLVADRDPFYFGKRYQMYDPALLAFADDAELVSLFDLDFKLPLVHHPLFSLTVFGDRASQKAKTSYMGGISGRIGGVLLYEGQFRALDKDFIPGYFGASYDLYRGEQYQVFNAGKQGVPGLEECKSYLASLGLALFDDALIFKLVSEGPVNSAAGRLYNWQGVFTLQEGCIPYFSFDILYDKRNMADFGDFMDWKQDSMVKARVNYHSGPALLSLVYALRHIPTANGLDTQIVAGIEGRVQVY